MSTVAAAAVARPRGQVGRRARIGHGVAWAVLLAALAVSLAPGLYMVALSFMDNPQLFAGRVIPLPPHPENYPRAWVASNIGRLYWNSIYVSTVSMVVTVGISALAGYGLGRIRFAGRGVVYGIVLVGLTIPLQIALIPLFINLRTLGLINTPFALIGPELSALLVDQLSGVDDRDSFACRALAIHRQTHQPPPPQLSGRERDVLYRLPSLSNLTEIATDLDVSINTVKSHVRAIYSKLGVSSRRTAVLAAHEHGLLRESAGEGTGVPGRPLAGPAGSPPTLAETSRP